MIAKTETKQELKDAGKGDKFRMRYHKVITTENYGLFDMFQDITTENRLEYTNDGGKTWTPVLVEEITNRTAL
jgi:hypothetical protein